MENIMVFTPCGVGKVWGIDRGQVLVEMDYVYLVSFTPEMLINLEDEGADK